MSAGLLEGVNVAKVMLGERAFHIPFNLIAQPMGDGKVVGVFQTTAGLPLLCGSSRTHVLLVGDMMFRPRLAFGSDAFRGSGLSVLATNGFAEPDKWMAGDVIHTDFR